MALTTDSVCVDVSTNGNERGVIFQVQACVYVWYWKVYGCFKCSINIKTCLWDNAKHKEADHKRLQIALGGLRKANFVLMFVVEETAYYSDWAVLIIGVITV